MNKPLRLGILIWRKGNLFEEKRFFTDLAKEAFTKQVEVLLFSPQDIQANERVRALCYHKGEGWKEQIVPYPDLVYDRFRNMKPEAFRVFVNFRQTSKLTFLNSRLAHKWNLHLLLKTHPSIANWLPETVFYTGIDDILSLLQRYQKVYLKPVNGTGGKGIITLKMQKNLFLLNGRDSNRKKVRLELSSQAQFKKFIDEWVKGTKYIVQQGLDLNWIKGSVTDFRLLVQKEANGKWGMTGLVGKIGPKDSATSNLHGGGKAVHAETFLSQYFSREKCKQLLIECQQLGLITAAFLEEKFGRLVELGIDAGIDRNGKLWMIEINPKPGRELFRQAGDLTTYHKAVRAPIEFALFLANRKPVE